LILRLFRPPIAVPSGEYTGAGSWKAAGARDAVAGPY
jgi:hypothetical protein